MADRVYRSEQSIEKFIPKRAFLTECSDIVDETIYPRKSHRLRDMLFSTCLQICGIWMHREDLTEDFLAYV